MASTRANQTIIRNISGSTMFFSFLGENGTQLANLADIAILGNIFDRWKTDVLQMKALKYALDNHLIEILKTPDVFVNDTVTSKPYKLGATSGSPVVLDPDYGSYTGSNTAPNPPNNP